MMAEKKKKSSLNICEAKTSVYIRIHVGTELFCDAASYYSFDNIQMLFE